MTVPPPKPAPPNAVQGGVFINPERPEVTVLRFQSGLATFDLMLDTANVVGFLRGVLKAAENEMAKAKPQPLLRPPSGLFLPNGNGAPPPTIPRSPGRG